MWWRPSPRRATAPRWQVADASAFGLPQKRERVLVVGIRTELLGEGPAFCEVLDSVALPLRRTLGLRTDGPISVEEALHDLSNDARAPWPERPNVFQTGVYGPVRPGTYAAWLRGDAPDGGLPDCHRFSNHGDRIRAMYEGAHATQPRGRLSREFMLSFGTRKDKKELMDPKKPASTITTHPDEFIHYAQPRNISLREMARLQVVPRRVPLQGPLHHQRPATGQRRRPLLPDWQRRAPSSRARHRTRRAPVGRGREEAHAPALPVSGGPRRPASALVSERAP